MAKAIFLLDENNQKVYPYAHASATFDSEGNTVEEKISTIETNIEDISEISDNAVQSVKIGSTEYKSGTTVTLPEYPSSISELSEDATHRTVTDTEKSIWNNKVDKESGKSLISNAEITRLASVDNYDDTAIKGRVKTLEDAGYITASDITNKADKSTTLSGYGITNAYTKGEVDSALGNKLNSSLKGANNGLAELDENGKVPSSQLPSYVDDVIEGALSSFPKIGETGKIYVDILTDKTYRWSGTQYVEISSSLALGETSSTAYAGNKGKANADAISALQTTVGALPTSYAPVNAQANVIETIKVNNAALTPSSKTVNITVPTQPSDIGAMASTVTHLSGDVPTTRKVNNKALSSDITLTASDIGALPSTTVVLTGGSQTSSSTADGGSNIYTFTKSDGTTSTLTVKNGSKGSTGNPGAAGKDGANGLSIGSITKTSTSGLTDTYTAKLSNGTSVGTFTVTNGAAGKDGTNGTNGSNGKDGKDGLAATITIGKVAIDDAGNASVRNSGTSSAAVLDFIIPKGGKGDKGDKGDPGENATTTAVATTSANGLMSSAMVTKLNGIATGATANTGTITAVQANGTNVATSGTANIPAASTSAYGVTKLSSSTSSSSTSLAATASAVKSVCDLANEKLSKSGGDKLNIVASASYTDGLIKLTNNKAPYPLTTNLCTYDGYALYAKEYSAEVSIKPSRIEMYYAGDEDKHYNHTYISRNTILSGGDVKAYKQDESYVSLFDTDTALNNLNSTVNDLNSTLTPKNYAITGGNVKTYGRLVTVTVYSEVTATTGGTKIGNIPNGYYPDGLKLCSAFNNTTCFMQINTDGSIYIVGSGKFRGVLTYIA